MAGETDGRAEHVEHHRAKDAARTLRGVIAGAVLVALIALAVENRHEVRVDWVFGDGDAELWLVIAIAALAGAVVGWLIAAWPRHR